MNYNINLPWLSLDDWQKEYIQTPPEQDCFLLCGRQVGKTTAMSIKAVELCVNHFKPGEFVLINSITEKQAYHMLAKALVYAGAKYPKLVATARDLKPTMHRINFRNGTGILCYAAGETGEGQRGFTIKKLMVDEGSRMSEEYFIASLPMLSVVKGSLDIASTPFGKRHKEGGEKFFYKCSKDDKFKKWYISAEDCPRHTTEFLLDCKNRMSKLAYAQEFLAIFTDELTRIFDDAILQKICTIKRLDAGIVSRNNKFYLGVDVAGMGGDEVSYEILERLNNNSIMQKQSIIEKFKMTTEITRNIIYLDKAFSFKKIGVDDGGIGFGVFSELMDNDATKRKTIALNNSSRPIDKDGIKSKKILKEEMYFNLLSLMENNKIRLLNDDELKASLASIQIEDNKIFGGYSHIAEGLIRAAWLAEKDKTLKVFAHCF
jgi:hypothetical protein